MNLKAIKDESEQKLRLRLVEEDRLRREAGSLVLVRTTASAFLAYTFDVEEIQWVLSCLHFCFVLKTFAG